MSSTQTEPQPRRLILNVPERLASQLDAIADSEGNGVPAVVRRLLSAALANARG
jgi:hypothetical protein